MKKFVILITVILLSAPFLHAQNDPSKEDYMYIEVVGKASREITPDKIFINISLSEKDFKNKSMRTIENDMVSALKSIGIDVKESLTVSDMLSNFKKHFIIKNDVRLSKDYQLIVKDGKTAAQAFIALQEKGISNVRIEKTENSKIEQFRNEIKVEAVKDAKNKAKMMVEAIDQVLGKAIKIEEQDNYYYAPRRNTILKSSVEVDEMGAAPDVIDVEFEKEKIEYSVRVRFLIK
jgi:uncharacterized protein